MVKEKGDGAEGGELVAQVILKTGKMGGGQAKV